MFRLIKHRKEIPLQFITFCIVSFLWLTGDTIIEFIFPTFLQNIGLSFFMIGLLLSLPSLVGMIVDIPVGDLSDRVSKKKLMVIGLLGSIITVVLIFFTDKVLVIGISLAIWGGFYQIWRVARDAYLVSITKPGHRSTMFGIDSAFLSAALTIGPLIGGITLAYFGLISNIVLYIIFLGIAILMILFMLKSKNKHKLGIEISNVIKKDKVFLKSIKDSRTFGFQGFILIFLSFVYAV